MAERDHVMRFLIGAFVLALVVTGVAWWMNDRHDDAQDEADAARDLRICRIMADVIETLETRTEVYREATFVDAYAWRGMRQVLRQEIGLPPDSPLIEQIDHNLRQWRQYRRQFDADLYPDPPETCKE